MDFTIVYYLTKKVSLYDFHYRTSPIKAMLLSDGSLALELGSCNVKNKRAE